MKRVFEVVLILAFLTLPWVAFGVAAPPQAAQPAAPRGNANVDARVRAALALASAAGQRRPVPPSPSPLIDPNPFRKAGDPCPCGCGCGPYCACTEGWPCSDPACGCGMKGKKPLTLNAAIDKAVAENRPLCIWVAERCVPCEKKMPNYIHTHVGQYERTNGAIVTESCVIVGKPDGQGGAVTAGTILGCPDDIAERVREMLNPRPVMCLPPPQPPMFFGGFGGGCST